MVFVLLVSVLFSKTPLPSLYKWVVLVGGEELKWRQLTHHHLMSQQDLILVHTVQLKPMIKAHSSGRMVSSISDVMITSVYSEKTCLKKLMMMMMKTIMTMVLEAVM